VVVRAGLVVALVTTLLLVPVMSFRIAGLWLTGAITTDLLPPLWFVGLHDMLSGHIWAELRPPDLPPRVAASERAFDFMYQSHRSQLHYLGVAGVGAFLALLFASAAAYLWNNRRLPGPQVSRTAERGPVARISDALARGLVVRRPLVRAGFFFTIRVLARSVQNRTSVGVPVAVAIAVAVTSLRAVGVGALADLSSAPIALLAIQSLIVGALVAGFRHTIRVPADLGARWLFHLIRPDNQACYMDGVKRAAIVRLVVPVLLALSPLHVIALGPQAAIWHFLFGLLSALVLRDACLLGYRRLPFASSYVPTEDATTYGGIYVSIFLVGVYTVAWLEHLALSTARGVAMLFAVTGTILLVIRGIDAWQRRNHVEVELDELVDPPTLRLGLTE
jgi:hypothetical protein